MAAVATHHHKTSTTSLARLQQLTNGLENQAKPSRPNSALLAPGYYPQAQPAQASGQAPTHPGAPSHAAQAQAQHAMHQYSQNHIMLLKPIQDQVQILQPIHTINTCIRGTHCLTITTDDEKIAILANWRSPGRHFGDLK